MLSRYTKFKINRRIRKISRKSKDVENKVKRSFRINISRRWKKFAEVRRFVFTWFGLISLLLIGLIVQNYQLRGSYLVSAPAPGGTFVEGLVGKITNLNPMFAVEETDASASRLIFNSLLKYDGKGELVPDLARSYSLDKDKTRYTVKLRNDVTWHDGEKFTADDVVFTFTTIQHPDTASPFNGDWRGVDIKAKGEYTVVFTLPNPFTPFPHILTTGLVPEHILGSLEPANQRPAEFNQNPVGTGPFKMGKLDTEANRLGLQANKNYFLSAPQLNKFTFKLFEDYKSMFEAYDRGELTAMAGLHITHEPEESIKSIKTETYDLPMTTNVMAFFKLKNPILKEKKVRQALIKAIESKTIFNAFKRRFVLSDSPILRNHLAYSTKLTQPKFDRAKAEKLLDSAGWKKGNDGIRRKKGKKLSLRLTANNSGEFPLLVDILKGQWEAIGVEVQKELIDGIEFNESYVLPHNYDVLITGINVGVDPDVYVYWHSSQSKAGGLNFSEYKSPTADNALEAGRTRDNDKLREAKYETFLKRWVKDLPAAALYRPAYIYVKHPNVAGLKKRPLVNAADRFNNVHEWTVNTELVEKVRKD